MIDFKAFPKIIRTTRPVVVTEKIDGTNACVVITEAGQVAAQSRSRVITPEDDNYGFAQWVADHADDLRNGLGPGHHFGEWWGQGINRGYGLTEKRFSLFNVGRWNEDTKPECCHVVPTLLAPTQATLLSEAISLAERWLRDVGSAAAPGFMRPEGFMLWFENGMYLKHVMDKPR